MTVYKFQHNLLEFPPLPLKFIDPFRMVPLTPVQKKIYLSVLRKELQTLLSFTGGSSRHQSLQNIVMVFFFLPSSISYICSMQKDKIV
jgi:hypothetical protein